MNRKYYFIIKGWQRLIKIFNGSVMKLMNNCAAHGVYEHQYNYRLSKVRSECYDVAVKHLQTTEANISAIRANAGTNWFLCRNSTRCG